MLERKLDAANQKIHDLSAQRPAPAAAFNDPLNGSERKIVAFLLGAKQAGLSEIAQEVRLNHTQVEQFLCELKLTHFYVRRVGKKEGTNEEEFTLTDEGKEYASKTGLKAISQSTKIIKRTALEKQLEAVKAEVAAMTERATKAEAEAKKLKDDNAKKDAALDKLRPFAGPPPSLVLPPSAGVPDHFDAAQFPPTKVRILQLLEEKNGMGDAEIAQWLGISIPKAQMHLTELGTMKPRMAASTGVSYTKEGNMCVSVEPYHLFRYLDEQAFRFNERKDEDGDKGRFLKALRGIFGKRLTWDKLTGKDGAILADGLPGLA